MPAPRVKPVDTPYTAEVQTEFDKVMLGQPPLLLFRTVARNPGVLQRMMAGGLLDRGSISIRNRELMILRTCANCRAEYEWGVHVFVYGDKAQWTEEQIHSGVHGGAQDACWDTEDKLIILLSDQLHKTSAVDDTLWAGLAARFTEQQLVELIMLAGLCHGVSFIVNALGVQQETFAPRFPSNAQPDTTG